LLPVQVKIACNRNNTDTVFDVIDLGDVQIKPSESVRCLGVAIDKTLSFDAHVNSAYKAANYHARVLRHIRKRATTDVAVAIATAMLGARMDYCNAILYGTNKSNIHKLQRDQNFVACIVTDTTRSEHITRVLARLHWLKIAEQIKYTVALLTFKALTLCMYVCNMPVYQVAYTTCRFKAAEQQRNVQHYSKIMLENI